MPRVRYQPGIEQIQGTLYDVVFKLSPQGKPIVTKRPDMSNVEWSEAQTAHRQRFKQANDYAKAAMADPDVRTFYEARAAKEKKRAYRMAFSDYFNGNDLLSGKKAGPMLPQLCLALPNMPDFSSSLAKAPGCKTEACYTFAHTPHRDSNFQEKSHVGKIRSPAGRQGPVPFHSCDAQRTGAAHQRHLHGQRHRRAPYQCGAQPGPAA